MQGACLWMALACGRAPDTATTAAEPLALGPPAPPPPALSRFSVPLEYDFSTMARLVEHAVPSTFGSMDSVHVLGTDDRRHYAFEAKRGAFTTFAHGGELHLRALVSYRARGYYKPPLAPTVSAGCGDDHEQPRVVVELAAPITLTPSWHLASRARLVKIEPASATARDRCDVGILHRDVTDDVVSAAKSAIVDHLPDIDRRIGDVNLTDRFTEWWALLAKPIRLADGVWLLLGPERLRMGRVSGHARVLSVPVSLDAHPRIVTGATEPVEPTLPLPALAHDTVGNGFHVLMDGVVDYATVTRLLGEALVGRKVTQKGRTVTVRSVVATPATKGQLTLAIAFDGAARGTLKFVGTPKFVPASGELTVPDLDYALDVNNSLLGTFAWLKSDALRKDFRAKAHIPVASALVKGRALLMEGLNRTIGDAVTLSGAVDSVAVRGLFVTRDGIVVRGEAMGRAGMAVRPH